VAELTVISWRDIPAQVVASAGRRARGGQAAKVALPDRFQDAIDRAAARAGKTDTDAYLAEWRRSSRACGDDLDAEVQAEAARLTAQYSDADLEALVRNGGVLA